MKTQTQPMSKEEVQAKIDEAKTRRMELEKRLTELSKESAMALVLGENLDKLEQERHATAEEVRHLGDLILGFEEAAKRLQRGDIEAKLRNTLVTLQDTKPVKAELLAKVEAAKQALKAAEAELKEVDDQRMYASRMRSVWKDELIKKYSLSEVEISVIEGQYKL